MSTITFLSPSVGGLIYLHLKLGHIRQWAARCIQSSDGARLQVQAPIAFFGGLSLGFVIQTHQLPHNLTHNTSLKLYLVRVVKPPHAMASTAIRFVAGTKKSPLGTLYLQCHVKPGASRVREGVAAVTDATVELCVSAQAREGEANKAVLKLLSEVSRLSGLVFQ